MYERKKILRFCKKHRLLKTLEAIKKRRYDDEIMRTLAKEAGVDRVIKALRDEGDLEWAYCFALYVRDLTEEHKTALVEIVCQSGSARRAFDFICYVNGLTKKQKTALVEVVCKSGNSYFALRLAYDVWGLTEEQRKTLLATIS